MDEKVEVVVLHSKSLWLFENFVVTIIHISIIMNLTFCSLLFLVTTEVIVVIAAFID